MGLREERIDWGVENLQEKVLRHRPDCVFIEFSINDAVGSRRMSLEHARNNLNQMIDRILEKNPACEIIPMVMNPVFGMDAGEGPTCPPMMTITGKLQKSGAFN